jgi:hypothetical protein
VQGVDFGQAPCRVRGAQVLISGPVHYGSPDGGEATIDLDEVQARVAVSAFQLDPICDPGIITFVFNGPVHLTDSRAVPVVSTDAALHDLSLTWDRLNHTIQISGGVEGGCFGGSASVTTPVPLAFTEDRACFSGGTLAIASPRAHGVLLFDADGSMHVDDNDDGSVDATFASCTDAALRACVP